MGKNLGFVMKFNILFYLTLITYEYMKEITLSFDKFLNEMTNYEYRPISMQEIDLTSESKNQG